jgi:hypothetical protein
MWKVKCAQKASRVLGPSGSTALLQNLNQTCGSQATRLSWVKGLGRCCFIPQQRDKHMHDKATKWEKQHKKPVSPTNIIVYAKISTTIQRHLTMIRCSAHKTAGIMQSHEHWGTYFKQAVLFWIQPHHTLWYASSHVVSLMLRPLSSIKNKPSLCEQKSGFATGPVLMLRAQRDTKNTFTCLGMNPG